MLGFLCQLRSYRNLTSPMLGPASMSTHSPRSWEYYAEKRFLLRFRVFKHPVLQTSLRPRQNIPGLVTVTLLITPVRTVQCPLNWLESLKNTVDNSAGNRQRVYVVDIDKDNDSDLLVINNYPSEIVFYRNDGLAAIENNSPLTTPYNYYFGQNYPNPFNPSTMINYQLPKTSNVEISIYNLLGQKVATLVNKKQNAGTYQVEWDASGFASGVYLYRIMTDTGYIETKKLLLLKWISHPDLSGR